MKSQIIPANASLVLVLALIIRSGFGHAECRAEDWPRFLGPRGDNTSTETGLLDMWPTNGLLLLWDRKVGSGYSAPSVVGTNLVLHHRLKDEEIIDCFDAATGRAVWRHSDASTFSDPFGYNNGPRGTPLLEGDHCYTYGAEGRLVCLQPFPAEPKGTARNLRLASPPTTLSLLDRPGPLPPASVPAQRGSVALLCSGPS